MLKRFLKRLLPSHTYASVLQRARRRLKPVHWGNLRRTSPISTFFGTDRGQPIDRYYIESFLQRHNTDVRGSVLEIGDPAYTLKYGGDRVTHSHVLHVTADNPQATIVGNLETGQGVSDNTYDCMILTQTLLFIYDVHAAIANCYRALKPGGVLLATFPGISQVVRYDMDRWGDYWRFTDASTRKLFGNVFGSDNVMVETHGNVLTACAFLYGLATSELKPKELDFHDPDYQVIITVRAVKK
ncbi:MAG TPA: methyltransferase domain-containing protein [Anaerolineales bacterium]|nr:methyltransferase domain-containing protein [Anaerolineales bacterium]